MSLQRNLPANYIGQVYVAVISLLMLPLYVRYLGAEAYGLVGIFTALQFWLQALDLGLAPTMGRELARCRAGVVSAEQVAGTVRAVEFLFGGLGLIAVLVIALAAGPVSRGWLKPEHLEPSEVALCLAFMGGAAATRWLAALYRAGVAGLERFVVLNVANVAIATLRWGGAVLVLMFWTRRPAAFFLYQLGVSVLEMLVLRGLFYRGFPVVAAARPRWMGLRELLDVAGGMAFLTALWVGINHIDKLVLSWTLGLADYGYFTLAATLASGIVTVTTPLNQVLQTRLTHLAATSEPRGFLDLYRAATQATTAVAFTVAGVMACFPQQVLWAWTGNATAAEAAAPILALYGPGHAVAAVLMMAFLMQFAHGQLRWHVIGSVLFAVAWVPGVYLASRSAGALGVGWLWLLGNLAYLLIWTPVVHAKLHSELTWRWLVEDVLLVVAAQAVVIFVAFRLGLAASDRLTAVVLIVAWSLALLGAGVLAGSRTRHLLIKGARSLLRPARSSA